MFRRAGDNTRGSLVSSLFCLHTPAVLRRLPPRRKGEGGRQQRAFPRVRAPWRTRYSVKRLSGQKIGQKILGGGSGRRRPRGESIFFQSNSAVPPPSAPRRRLNTHHGGDGQPECEERSLLFLASVQQALTEGTGTSIRLDTRGFGRCLLYTSPSPRDATLSRMPSSA